MKYLFLILLAGCGENSPFIKRAECFNKLQSTADESFFIGRMAGRDEAHEEIARRRKNTNHQKRD